MELLRAAPFPIREIQTDNGTEFTNALLAVKAKHKTMFEEALEFMGILYHRIRIATPRHNGSEFLDSEAIKKAAKCGGVYYAHPYSSWERGSNENGNRILRRFIPKGTDIGELTDRDLQRIEDWVNNYPRKILGYKTSNEMTA